MFTAKFKREFPKWLAFSYYDYAGLEQALRDSPLFAREGLCLLSNVPAIALHQAVGSPDCGEMDVLDLLVCRGDQALLALVSREREDYRRPLAELPGLDYLYLSQEDLEQGRCEAVLDRLEDVALRQPARWHCYLRSLPPECVDQLLACQALCRREGALQPTEYGASVGLVRRRAPREPDAVLCEPTVLGSLLRMLDMLRSRSVPAELLAGNDELARFQEAMRTEYPVSEELFRYLADTTLEDYMEGRYPEQLLLLRSHLTAERVTLRDAALAIRSLLTAGQEERFDTGLGLLRALAAPAVDYAQARIALSRVQAGPPQPDCEPDLEALADCRRSDAPPGVLMARMPLPVFLQGTAASTGLGYPLWLAHMLLRFFRIPQVFPYAGMLREAVLWLDSGGGDEDDPATGLYILYLLLVEPFCLSSSRRNN